MTGREHLQMYALLRGLSAQRAAAMVSPICQYHVHLELLSMNIVTRSLGQPAACRLSESPVHRVTVAIDWLASGLPGAAARRRQGVCVLCDYARHCVTVTSTG